MTRCDGHAKARGVDAISWGNSKSLSIGVRVKTGNRVTSLRCNGDGSRGITVTEPLGGAMCVKPYPCARLQWLLGVYLFSGFSGHRADDDPIAKHHAWRALTPGPRGSSKRRVYGDRSAKPAPQF